MGLDFRVWEANEPASRTDSMMLITYDPLSTQPVDAFHSP
jgi:anionic cell wall polymer biosynthesis LytR-Cps2A-Psr (LCP) family protein